MDYEGIVIAESLVDASVLEQVEVLESRIESASSTHQTPWISQWTYLTVRIPDVKTGEVAESLSAAIDPAHPGAWYADFKNATHHYVIFKDKVFFIDRRKPDEYAEAQQYGISRGLPKHQADFVSLLED